jgi:hypothetical protein
VVDIAQKARRAEVHRKKQTTPMGSLLEPPQGTNLESYLFPECQEGATDGSRDVESGGDGERRGPQSPSPKTTEPKTSNKWRQLEEYCSRDLNDSHLTLVEKVWLIIARTDGECGQLLGQAAIDRFDGIRSWTVSYLLWGALSKPCVSFARDWPQSNNSSLLTLPKDITLPASRSDFSRAISELKYLLAQHDLQTLPSTSSSQSPPLCSSSSSQIAPHHDENPLQSIESSQFDHFFFVTLAMEIFQMKRNELSTIVRNSKQQQDQASASSASLSPESSSWSSSSVGKLVPVHCGHNGWPNRDELSQFSEYFSEIEFVKEKELQVL